jgi:hypothetical protein
MRSMNEDRRLEECAVVDVGRPFTHHVPSDGKGPSGFVFEGFTGENARPWSAAQVLAAAHHRMFGFTLIAERPVAPGTCAAASARPA